MKLIIDNALAPSVSRRLRDAGYDSIHVRDRNMQAATDEEILTLAAEEERVIVSADTDFGALLALRSYSFPSFVLLRRQRDKAPKRTADLLISLLPEVAPDLESGSVIVVTDDRVRIRPLPVVGE